MGGILAHNKTNGVEFFFLQQIETLKSDIIKELTYFSATQDYSIKR